jgi:hypothetical protein
MWKIHNKFHASLLTPMVENTIYGKHNPLPPPILISGEEEGNSRIEYLVRWKGYGLTEDLWEPESNLENSKEDLETYKENHNLN